MKNNPNVGDGEESYKVIIMLCSEGIRSYLKNIEVIIKYGNLLWL